MSTIPGGGSDGIERRQYVRIPAKNRVLIALETDRSVSTVRVRDLSRTGIGLQSKAKLPVGTVFTLRGDWGAGLRVIRCEVVSCRPGSEGGFVVAARFQRVENRKDSRSSPAASQRSPVPPPDPVLPIRGARPAAAPTAPDLLESGTSQIEGAPDLSPEAQREADRVWQLLMKEVDR